MMRVLFLLAWVACSTTPAAPDAASPVDASPGNDATSDANGDASGDSSNDTNGDASAACDPADQVTYSGNKKTIMTSWGCAVAWDPTNVKSPISLSSSDGGVTKYPLTVIGEFCPPDPMVLDPLRGGTSLNFTSSVGIWSLRFRTPSKTGQFQMYFDVYGGDASAQEGARFSMARYPGEFHDGQANSCSYCDFGGQNAVVSNVVAQIDTSKPKTCQLEEDTVYYFNVVVPALDPRGNSSVLGWSSGF
ncbi:MAG TPA: hypothetical protein VH054_02370 [Polyangiaceae bacterium]|nr:hypothetical protein [Polyangiaceae bacterium]